MSEDSWFGILSEWWENTSLTDVIYGKKKTPKGIVNSSHTRAYENVQT